MKSLAASFLLAAGVAALCALAGGSCTPARTIAEGEGELGGEGEGQAGEGEGEGQAGEGEGEGQAGEGEGEGEGGFAPNCANDGDCASVSYCQGTTCTCDTQSGFCVPQQQSCTDNSQCTTPPLTACDTQTGQCTFGTCTNGGVTCDEGQTCAADGRCVNGSAAPCAVDDDCTDPNEYCNVALGQSNGACTLGCRSDFDCNNGQLCSGGHSCVDSAGAFGDACADADGNADDNLCGAGLFCGTLSKTCQERCSGGPVQCSNGSCCALSNLGCCNQFGFCSAQGC